MFIIISKINCNERNTFYIDQTKHCNKICKTLFQASKIRSRYFYVQKGKSNVAKHVLKL